MMMLLYASVILATVLSGGGVGVFAAITQDEALVLGEFFVAVKFGNTTPVTMDNACTNWPGKVICVASNTVISELNFTSQGLLGTLPASLFRLSQLYSITLNKNNITGTLPSSFASMPQLVTFTADYNQLNGTLSSEFSSWRNIDKFSVPFNSLVGTLPDSYKSWSKIRTFDVRNNKLNGTLPREYSAWNSTTQFHVEDNRMSGTLPPEYSNWAAPQEFVANDNVGFYGTIPAEYGRWGASFRSFFVGGNVLNGTLPVEYSNWTSINSFGIANNSFSGTLPPEYDAWVAVEVFRIQYNLLSGTLPSRYSAWTMLRLLAANNNMFDGTLPPQYTSWQSIGTIYLLSNRLTGSIPPQYKNWGATVTSIVLDNNQLTGPIPSDWGSSMTQLDTFSVSNNSLSGMFPPSLKFPVVTIVSFGYNNLSGPIPPFATTWPKLTVLDVQNNTYLSGSLALPTWMIAATVCGTQLCLGAAVLSAYQVTSCMPAGLLYSAAQTKSLPLLLKAANDNAYSLTACSATTTAAPQLPTAAPPQQQFASHQQPIISPTVRGASAAMVYTTIIAGGLGSTGRGGVPGLQRAVASLRLAARCNAATSSSRSNASSISDDDAPMFSDLADNPLGVSVSVGAATPSLDAAAGASVMNAVLVCVIGVALHVSAKLQRWWLKRAQRSLPSDASASSTSTAPLLQVLVSLVPSALLPGSLAAPFGTLLQPGIGACVVLVVSSARGASSVVCGVLMACVWVQLPLYCIFAVMVRGRRIAVPGTFGLQSVPRYINNSNDRKRRSSSKLSSSRLSGTFVVAGKYHRKLLVATEKWALWSPHEFSSLHARRHRRDSSASFTSYREYAEYLLENMEAVFGGYVGGREWYFAVDWGVALVGGAVMGGAEAASYDGDACAAAVWGTWCAVVLGVVQVGALVALRPNSVRLELWSGIVLGLLGLLSVVLSLAGVDDAAESAATVGSILEPVVVLLLLLGTWRRVFERSQKQPDADEHQEQRLKPTSTSPPLRRDLNEVVQRAGVSGRTVAATVGVSTGLSLVLAKQPTSDHEVKEQLQAVVELICEQRSARTKI